MLSSQVIQTSIEELRTITRVDLCVYDPTGAVMAATAEMKEIHTGLISAFAASPADSQVIGSDHLLKVWDEGELLFVIVARGAGDDAYMVGKIAASKEFGSEQQ